MLISHPSTNKLFSDTSAPVFLMSEVGLFELCTEPDWIRIWWGSAGLCGTGSEKQGRVTQFDAMTSLFLNPNSERGRERESGRCCSRERTPLEKEPRAPRLNQKLAHLCLYPPCYVCVVSVSLQPNEVSGYRGRNAVWCAVARLCRNADTELLIVSAAAGK